MDAHQNFAYSTVLTAPSPAASGTSLVVQTGHGTRFPTPPFNATVWPLGAIPIPTNAEIVRVTAIVGDTLTITRTQESTSARSVVVGDQIAATITAKTLTDVEGMGLDDLADVLITAPAANALLQYNGADWIDVASIAASVISAGTFGSGDYTFSSDLTITDFLQGTTTNGYLDFRGDSGATNGMRLNDLGNLLMGTTTAATGPPRLDIVSPDFPQLVLANVDTNNTLKAGYMGIRSYANAEETVEVFGAICTDALNVVDFGGGLGTLNAATNIRFFTASAINTLTGTNRLSINGSGNITWETDTNLHRSAATMANGAGAGAGTLTNAPAAGDPTKWLAVDDNGTTRYVPSW